MAAVALIGWDGEIMISRINDFLSRAATLRIRLEAWPPIRSETEVEASDLIEKIKSIM